MQSGFWYAEMLLPGCTSLHPGYKEEPDGKAEFFLLVAAIAALAGAAIFACRWLLRGMLQE